MPEFDDTIRGPDDLQRAVDAPFYHDLANNVIKFPVKEKLNIIADCKDQEVVIERGKESVLVKKSEIPELLAMLGKALELFSDGGPKSA